MYSILKILMDFDRLSQNLAEYFKNNSGKKDFIADLAQFFQTTICIWES
jgi:hypothetical protein